MEKIAFVGGYDKSDLLIFIAKTLVNLGKKVIVVDTTASQRTKYIVPTMKSGKQYITTYEEVDIAIGFSMVDEIKQYLGIDKKMALDYDYMLLDIDSYRGYYYFQIKPTDYHFLVTSMDLYSLRRAFQTFKKVEGELTVTPIIFSKDQEPAELRYIKKMTSDLKIKWGIDQPLYFPFETKDLNALYSNQRTGRISLRGLSQAYVDSLEYMIILFAPDLDSKVNKAIKKIDG